MAILAEKPNRRSFQFFKILKLLLIAFAFQFSGSAYGQRPSSDPPSDPPASAGATNRSEEDDYRETPFTEYGEFNEQDEEESDAQFFQYSRFFGVSLGLGFQFVDGNRGQLWQGGFPLVDFKIHYWFDFNVALDLGLYVVSHNFYTTASNQGQVNVSMYRVGADIKYYFTTKNLSSAISFSNPYIIGGIGGYSKAENAPTTGNPPTMSTALGVCAGLGLEFILNPKKLYIELEGKINIVPFSDMSSNLYQASNGLPDLTGNFWTLSSSFLYTW